MDLLCTPFTSDCTWGPLRVFVRQIITSPVTWENFLSHAVSTAILLLCIVYSENLCPVCYSVLHVCCLNLDSVVFHSDFCLASFLLFKCLLPTISFSFSYNLNLNIKTTRFTMQPSLIIDFHIFVYMLSFLTDIVFYYNLNSVQPAIRFVSLKI